MRKKLLLLLFCMLSVLPALARDFEYTYEGQTITYTVIDEEAKTCQTKDGVDVGPITGNIVEGDLILPANPKDGDVEYTLIKIGIRAFCGCDGLTSVEIPNTVTSIERSAFIECSGLTSLEIPNSVKSIGEYAFYYCNELTSIVIPESVTSIGDRAFMYCKKLPSIEIPDSVTSIGDSAFACCEKLPWVIIGKSVTEIGGDVFFNCPNLKKAAYPNMIQNPFEENVFAVPYESEDAIIENGWIYGSGKSSICFAPVTLEGDYVMPESITSIGEYSFSGCSGLTSFEIGTVVTSIPAYAFAGCSGLTSVVIPSNVSEIGWGAFSGCLGLIKSAYPNNLSNPFENGIVIAYDSDDAVFEDGLIYNGDKSALYFAPLNFKGDYILPETVTSIGQYVFYGCEGLSSVKTLSENPASVPVNAFEGLYETAKLTIPDASAVYKYLTTVWGLFKNIQTNSGQELPYFSDGNIEYRLNSADRTATVTGVENQSSLRIPASFMADAVRYSVKSIGIEAFKGKKIYSVDFDPECEIEVIGDRAFEDSDLSDIKLPSSVRVIGNHAFCNTPDLYKVELNDGLATIGEGAFAAPEIRYSKAITIPSTVKAIGADAFYNYECTKVETPDIVSWCSIDFGNKYANPIYNTGSLYVGEEQLTELQIPEGVEEVKAYAFYNCYYLSNVELPEGLKRIGSDSFYNCWMISDLTIPASVVEIDDRAFYYCSSMKNVAFPKGLERIGSESFYGCSDLSEVTIPSNVVEIGDKVFAARTVAFSDGLLPINVQNNTFYNRVQNLYWGRPLDGMNLDLWDLSSLEIGGLITEIPDGMFKECRWLGTLTLGSGLTTIGEEAFRECSGLWEVIVPPSVEKIGAYAFAGAINLHTIIMGHNVKTIGERAFNSTEASTISITAPVPPTAPNNTFSKYEGTLYVQDNEAVTAYSNAPTCWNRFDSYVMVTPTGMDLKGAEDISGNPGETFQLTAKLMPENVTLPQIFWHSTNPEVATVDHNGVVTLHADNVEMTTRAKVLASCKIIAESLYADGPVAQVSLTGEVTGVGEIIVEGKDTTGIDYTQPYEVYNLSGVKVSEMKEGLAKGIYIVRQGNSAVKISVKD